MSFLCEILNFFSHIIRTNAASIQVYRQGVLRIIEEKRANFTWNDISFQPLAIMRQAFLAIASKNSSIEKNWSDMTSHTSSKTNITRIFSICQANNGFP